MDWYPQGRAYPPETSPCCAACRRGTRAFGLLPCALKGDCPCHRKDTK